jgi:hypothetical protein
MLAVGSLQGGRIAIIPLLPFTPPVRRYACVWKKWYSIIGQTSFCVVTGYAAGARGSAGVSRPGVPGYSRGKGLKQRLETKGLEKK